MNENKLREAIRKELKTLNEGDVESARQAVSAGFNAANDITLFFQMIEGALAGGAFLGIWLWLKPHIEAALSKKSKI